MKKSERQSTNIDDIRDPKKKAAHEAKTARWVSMLDEEDPTPRLKKTVRINKKTPISEQYKVKSPNGRTLYSDDANDMLDYQNNDIAIWRKRGGRTLNQTSPESAKPQKKFKPSSKPLMTPTRLPTKFLKHTIKEK